VTGTAERVYLALGSNLGDRDAHLREAREALAALPGTQLIDASSVEETRPLGGMRQPPYLNQMVLVETELEPRALLEACQAIETRAGRIRGAHWGPRTLDIDIVRYGNRRIAEPDLVIPHPGVTDRDFWQRELAELERHER
jgi:2-amino-4-hydroxy-6-hydroxymethyldihydropteridine diphosphokinase